jgi:TfoX/Sxy family transcriptional regulator of competence genes
MVYDDKTARRVRKILSTRHDVVERQMMGGLCFMLSGNICCAVSGRGGMLIRIDKGAQERMLAEPHARPMEMRGRIMKGFVRLAPEGYRTAAALKRWIARGLDAAAERAREKPKAPAPRRKR